MQESTVSSRGAVLYALQRGPVGAPVVVLVHGYPDTHRCWDELAERLQAGHRVVAYDTRGMGRSSAPPGPLSYALPRLAEDLAAVIQAVSPERPVHLVGHDWGAFQCWEAAAAPELAERIASLTVLAGPRVQASSSWVRRRLRHPTLAALGELAGQARRSWYVGFFQLPWLPERVVGRAATTAWPVIMRRLERVEPRPGHPAESLAHDAVAGISLYRDNFAQFGRRRDPPAAPVPAPAQVIIPTHDRYISPALYAESDRWATRVLRRELAAGHWVQRSHPDQIAAWVTEFVAAREAEFAPANRPGSSVLEGLTLPSDL